MDEKEEDFGGMWGMLRIVSSLGFAVVLGTVLSFLVGYGINKWLFPIGNAGMAIIIFLGAIASVYWCYLRVGQLMKKLFIEGNKKAKHD